MNIRIDEKNLTAASVMPLFEAAQKIADMTGELVTIEAYDGIKFEPAQQPESNRHPATPNVVEPHKWPDLNDCRPREGRDDGWFEHDGCTQPYADSALVDVMTETGNIITGRLAMNLAWNWSDPCVHRITWHRPHRPESHCTTSSLLKDQAS